MIALALLAAVSPVAACSNTARDMPSTQSVAPTETPSTSGASQSYLGDPMYGTTLTIEAALSKTAPGLEAPDPAVVGTPVKVVVIEMAGAPTGTAGINMRYADGVGVSISPRPTAPLPGMRSLPPSFSVASADFVAWGKAEVAGYRKNGGGYSDGRDSPFDVVSVNGRSVIQWRVGWVRYTGDSSPKFVPGKLLFTAGGTPADYMVVSPNVPGVSDERMLDFVRAIH